MNTARHYDLLIEEDNDPFRDSPLLQAYMDQWDGQRFIDCMQLHSSKTALEIGIGTGRIAAKVAPHCLHLTGIDLSEKTIVRAAENLSAHRNITLICDDFSTHSFDETYDVVYSSLTLMHFNDKQAFINKAASLLKQNGIFCLSIDKNPSESIDMGCRKLKIYPDTLESTLAVVDLASLLVTEHFETEMAHIIVCTKR